MLAWILFHLGLLYIVTASFIGAPFRMLAQRLTRGNVVVRAFLYCGGCVGFWLGALEWRLWPEATREVAAGPLQLALMGCGLGALWAYFVPSASEAAERETIDDEASTSEAGEAGTQPGVPDDPQHHAGASDPDGGGSGPRPRADLLANYRSVRDD